MSAILQSGQHPDADQLSAFVEDSLPLHEHQATLAHLATCADCRAIVYLAETVAIDQSVQPKPVVARKPWLSGWNLAWPAAAAVGCLILLILPLRNINKARPVTTARLQPASPPLVSPPQVASVLEPQPKPAPAASSASPPPAAKSPHAASEPTPQPASALDRAAENKSYPQLPLPANASQRNPAAFQSLMSHAQQSPNSNTSSVAGASNGNHAIHGGLDQANLNENDAAGVPGSSAVVAGSAALLQPHPAGSAAQPASSPAPARALHSLNQQYNAAPPTPMAPAPPPTPFPAQASPSQTIQTTDALAAQPEDNAVSTVIAGAGLSGFAAKRLTKVPSQPILPSHLPVRSTVSNSHQQLAIDTSGALFRSEDAGVTWQSVPARWTGHALRVSLSPSPNQQSQNQQSQNPQIVDGKISGQSSAASPAAAPAPPVAFELTTDTGQHWISPDGLAWKRN